MESIKHSHDTAWIKAWIALGALVIIASITLPIALAAYAVRDINRYQQCAAGIREDCQQDILWSIYEQALKDNGAQGLMVSGTNADYSTLGGDKLDSQARAMVRTSDKSALITKAELKDMTLANGWYRAKVGSVIDVTATIDGKPDKVALYLSDKNPENPTDSTKVMDMKAGADGVYTGKFTVNKDLLGELEIRASGPGKESTSLYLNVAAE